MKKTRKVITPDPRVAYFDHQAAGWDADADRVAHILARLTECRELLALTPGEDLLEVGCGTGQITGWLCEAVAPGRVVAMDFSAEMLARARAKRLPAEFRLHDICAAPAEPAAFDVALCFHSFPHFRDKPAALAHLAACLRPRGRLILMHLAGRSQVNAVHAGFGGAVGRDRLPARRRWPGLLAPAGMSLAQLIDRADLFLLRALPAPA
jgi:SAM-dependent methyltransferase